MRRRRPAEPEGPVRTRAPQQVECPECGTVREVGYRNAHRIRRGEAPAVCDRCRRGLPALFDAPTEAHRRYWLRWAGCQLPRSMTAAEWVRLYGLPDSVRELEAAISHVFEHLKGRPL